MISNRDRTLLVAAMLLSAGAALAQQPTAPKTPRAARPKAGQTLEIRGQVPTPQVVTVRPRQIPVFSREVLTPAYFDPHFWDSLIAPYEIAPSASSGVPLQGTPAGLPAAGERRPPAADSSKGSPKPPVASAAGVAGPSQPPPPSSGLSQRTNDAEAAQGTITNAPREK